MNIFAMNFGHRIRSPANLQWSLCVSQESLGGGGGAGLGLINNLLQGFEEEL